MKYATLGLGLLLLCGCSPLPSLSPDQLAIHSKLEEPLAAMVWRTRLDTHAMPEAVRLQDKTWRLMEADSLLQGKMLAGLTDCDSRIIYYALDQEHDDVRNTILHELLHAGACNHGGAGFWNTYDLNTHVGIYNLAAFLQPLIRDNPQLVHWLEEK